MQSKNAVIGIVLFIVYLVLYGAFVLINAFTPQVMEVTPLPGINLAIVYGFGLIFAAFALAMLYGVLCKGDEVKSQGKDH
ncbi:MAG: DUF485 domain-containing protein [Planctomycetaceae bacterium]|nr:DUF485 domain-containing protein [Planctomycetaceae bacterium]